ENFNAASVNIKIVGNNVHPGTAKGVMVRLGGLRVLRIGDDVYANGEKIDSPHRPALDALASNIALTAENFGDALEDPSFLAMLAALVNSGYWFFEG
ncbi:winged helix domain-containing protein, partial [Escherichia sp. SP-MK]